MCTETPRPCCFLTANRCRCKHENKGARGGEGEGTRERERWRTAPQPELEQCWEKLNDFSTYSFPGQSWWLAHSQGQRGSGGLGWLRCEGTGREQGVTRLLPIPLPGFSDCSVPEARGWMRQTLYMCSWLGLSVPLPCAALCLMMDITGRVNSHSFLPWLQHCERFPYRSRRRGYRGKMGVWEPRCWDVLLPSSAAK